MRTRTEMNEFSDVCRRCVTKITHTFTRSCVADLG